jgi:predicted helicase
MQERPGKALERLIASIEKALAGNSDVLVEAPKRLPDRTTGTLREHDVVLTIKQSHHALMVAVECRDLSRPVTVNQVEGFWAKCQDTGIGQGIIVSSTGFYNTARQKADHL